MGGTAMVTNDSPNPIIDQPLYSGGNGTSFETAIVINTISTSVGIPAEFKYISNIYGQKNVDWFVVSQSLMTKPNKYYDVLLIKLSNDDKKSIFFDITQFYGKF